MMEAATDEIWKIGKDMWLDVINAIKIFLNDMINGFAPNHPTAFVFFISLLLGVIIQKSKKEKLPFGIIATIIIFGFLRWFGLG